MGQKKKENRLNCRVITNERADKEKVVIRETRLWKYARIAGRRWFMRAVALNVITAASGRADNVGWGNTRSNPG